MLSSELSPEELEEILTIDWWFTEVSGKHNMPAVGVSREQAHKLIVDELRPILDSLTDIQNQLKEIRGMDQGGWKRARRIIVGFGAPAAIVGVNLAMLAITCGALYQSFSHVKEETMFRTRTEDRLQIMEARLLNSSTGISPQKALGEIGSLQPKALSEALPALRRATERPISGLPAETVRRIGQNLAQVNEQSLDYWPTAFQYVHFATFALNPDVPPPGPPWYLDAENGDTSISGRYERRSLLLGKSAIFKNVIFVKCRIVVKADATIQLENVVFVDCVFDFPTNGETGPSIREIAKTLLASGFSRASVPST